MSQGFVLNIPLEMLDRLDDADKKIDKLFQAFLLREEKADGNLSEKIG